MKKAFTFSQFVNESFLRKEVVDIWNIFSQIEKNEDRLTSEELDDYLYGILTQIGLRVADPLGLYMKFKRLSREYRAENIEWDEALMYFTDSVNILMFERVDKKY